jgi:CheY-like chemotaxis protein
MILVVEDDPELQDVLLAALEDEGLSVQIAMSGKDAMESVTASRPSLVVLDWALPNTDGGEVARHIREVHGPDVPIVLLTADGQGAAKAARIGAFAMVAKPFDLDVLLDTIRRGLTPS